MAVLRRIGPGSVFKVVLITYLLIGVIMAAILALVSAYVTPNPYVGVLGPFVFLVIPIAYGLVGAIAAVIGAALYNIVAGWVGGVRFDVQ
ncbi:MAG TPA: hypothetical protein VN709_05650 [Terriglobales bacterium]|nr:hypothetical protein [Terriglobales bacterium]